VNSVCAIVVTYRPENARLAQVLSALRGSVNAIVLVDNASAELDEARLREAYPSLIVKRLESNKGIAAAQNEGIALARHMKCRYVLFLDQDSLPQPGMVPALCRTLEALQAAGQQVACVGPRVRLPGSPTLSGFHRLGWLGLRSQPCPDDNVAVECDFLLSSGSLVPLEVIDRVGGMEEALFIDQVDTEWCLRARSMGYRVFGACGAILEHRLGEAYYRIWFGRWRHLPRHKPFRYYYIFRNSLLLLGRHYVPSKWVWFQLQWLGALFLRYGIFSRDGKLGMMLKGTVHGMRRMTGKLEAAVAIGEARTVAQSQANPLRTLSRPNCKLCGGAGEVLYADLRDRLFSAPGTWHFRRCGNEGCGLIWLDPEASDEDIGRLYRGYYTHGGSDGEQGMVRSSLRYAFRSGWAGILSATRIMNERKRLETLFVDDLPPGELLEIGCGAGNRLPLFSALGWRVTGQDIDAEAAAQAERARDVEIHVGPVEELAARGRRFDAIVMNHVIEHVPDPVGLLRTCLAMLRSGGTVTCVTPNADSWGHRAFGVNWMGLDPPRHLTLFTPVNLRTAAKMAGHSHPQVSTSCANAQAFAVGSFEIESKGRYDMGGRPAWRSQFLSIVAQFRALNAFRRNPDSGDELIMRCRA
jgi:rhamnosyltransferase